MAPAAGAAASATALSFKSLVHSDGFAVGSWDVPRDMIAKIHQGEMIVPSQFAENARNGGNFSDSPSKAGDRIELHVHATDAQSVARLFRDNGHHLVAALQKQRRNLAF
jgi:hypothetical protein